MKRIKIHDRRLAYLLLLIRDERTCKGARYYGYGPSIAYYIYCLSDGGIADEPTY